MKVAAHNPREGAKECVCVCVCQPWVCVRGSRAFFAVKQVDRLYMYANVHKEQESLISPKTLHTCARTHKQTHTHVHTRRTPTSRACSAQLGGL